MMWMAKFIKAFFDQNDKSICDLIRQTAPEHLATLSIDPHDSRLKTLFFRYKARNYPETLNDREKIQWRDVCRDKLSHEVVNHYLVELEQLALVHQHQPNKLALLKDLYHYCQYLVN